MPVYKDNYNNRRLDRVGKHYGKAVAVVKPSSPEAIDNTRYRDNRPNRVLGRVGKLIPKEYLRPNRGIKYSVNIPNLLAHRGGEPIVKKKKRERGRESN